MQIIPIHRITEFQSHYGGEVFHFKVAGWLVSAEYDECVDSVIFDAYNARLDLEVSGSVDPTMDCHQQIANICISRGF